MNFKTANPITMMKEIFLALTGTVLLLVAFAFQYELMKESTPLPLFIILSIGLLTSFRYKLLSGTLLCFSGLALLVHPFLYSSSYWLIPGATLVGLAGFMILINWWNQKDT
jgi:hypothetical protein